MNITFVKNIKNKKAQVWIETVLYLLIGLAIIGAVLAFVRPKIAEIQDKIVIDQSLELLKNLDDEITQVWNNGEGNKQIEEVEINKGEIKIDALKNEIVYTLKDSKVVYSQLGTPANLTGNIQVLTEKKGSSQDVSLRLKYGNNLNLLYQNEDGEKIFTKSPTAYKWSIQNNGSAININEV